jgi:hypothetical protein
VSPEDLERRLANAGGPAWSRWIVVDDPLRRMEAERLIGFGHAALRNQPRPGHWIVIGLAEGGTRWVAVPVSIQAVHETLEPPESEILHAAEIALAGLGRATGRA